MNDMNKARVILNFKFIITLICGCLFTSVVPTYYCYDACVHELLSIIFIIRKKKRTKKNGRSYFGIVYIRLLKIKLLDKY